MRAKYGRSRSQRAAENGLHLVHDRGRGAWVRRPLDGELELVGVRVRSREE
jgi:hypothetical protein